MAAPLGGAATLNIDLEIGPVKDKLTIAMVRTILKIMAGLLIVLIAYALIQPFRLTTTEVTIKDSDIPAEFAGKKIVFLSDLHYGHFMSQKRLGAIVNKTNSMGADIIVLGGDYIEIEPSDYEKAFAELSNLSAPLGVYGVLGNHDYKKGREYIVALMERSGIKSLNNKALWLESGQSKIKIGGVGDLWLDDQDMSPILDGVSVEDFTVLLSHNPDYIKEINRDKIDITLSGHTHAGQITAFGLWAPWVPSKYGQELRYGLKDIDNAKLFVTSGIGTAFMPLRAFTRPEIVTITLQKD